MKTYVWVSFAFMGWAYYEVSGGADFQPVERDVIVAEAAVEAAPEVTRAAPELLSVSTSNITSVEAPEAQVITASVQEPAPVTRAEPVVEIAAAPTPAPEPAPEQTPVDVVTDIREVAGNRVNMRSGPGTNFDVIVTLNGGTALEVIEIDESGWANVATLDRGVEGWMAERLLTDPDA
ncbi:SH3 domain-containing protein [Pseudooctadecabacter jejudonensis]|uniref:Bacterial SH3 domain protein n=1 Tax=Pseudooctadecabacter jejudonensis TaxID=1391910 RepID=A0A1Y5RZ44_9RHOB|nr:SH3 domain-containing protein [Pseudooctadecabacter jejudonensis]SLN28978.1 Bacterial SH3 domain protein [Pseudooctadecabacter jejudonensis]